MHTRKWITPGMHTDVPDTTRPAKPIPELPGGSQMRGVCPNCGKVQCACKPKTY